jgi:hypothetical protein
MWRLNAASTDRFLPLKAAVAEIWRLDHAPPPHPYRWLRRLLHSRGRMMAGRRLSGTGGTRAKFKFLFYAGSGFVATLVHGE